MRIVMFGNDLTMMSGHSRLAWQTARSLIELGHSARIVASAGKAREARRHHALLTEASYRQLHDDALEFPSGSLTPRNEPLRRQLADVVSQADLVHVFDMRALRALALMFGGRPPVRTVLQISSLPNLNPRYIMQAGPTSFLRLISHPKDMASAIVPPRYVQGLLRLADAVVCTSQFLADVMARCYREAAGRIQVAHAGVDMPDINSPPHDGHPDFVYFGWPGAHRGTLDAAKAFGMFRRECPQADCVVSTFRTGGSRLEESFILAALAGRYARQGVQTRGFVPDIRALLPGARAAVLPFRSPFGYAQPPIVVLESMAAGVPVISTNVGSMCEMLRHGHNGFVVRRGDIGAIVHYMRLLWQDAGLHARMSAAARATVADKFDQRLTFRRMLEIYERIGRQ